MSIETLAPQTSVRHEMRHNDFSTILSVVGVNLFLARRRTMTLVLLGILLLLFAVETGFLALIYSSLQTAQNRCSPGDTQCQGAPRQALDAALKFYGGFITFPTSLGTGGGFAGFIGALLLAILVGTLVGSEYAYGTLRTPLSRGLGRATILAGQVTALAVMSLVVSIVMLGAGALVGVTLGPLFGLSAGSISAEGAREIAVYGLAVGLNVLVYGLFALCFATLGRSSAAGIGGAVGLLFLEFLANFIFAFLTQSRVLTGDIGEKISHVPDWFPGNNVGALAAHAGAAPIPLTQLSATTLDLTHAALVTAVYVVVLIGGSYALLRTRDMTD